MADSKTLRANITYSKEKDNNFFWFKGCVLKPRSQHGDKQKLKYIILPELKLYSSSWLPVLTRKHCFLRSAYIKAVTNPPSWKAEQKHANKNTHTHKNSHFFESVVFIKTSNSWQSYPHITTDSLVILVCYYLKWNLSITKYTSKLILEVVI